MKYTTRKLDGAIIDQPRPGRLNLEMFHARRPQNIRCQRCARLLGKFVLSPGTYIDIACPRCKAHRVIDVDINSTSILILEDILKNLNGETPESIKNLLKSTKI